MSKNTVCDPAEIYMESKEKSEWLPKNFGVSMLGMCERSSILKKVHAPQKKMDAKKRRKQLLKFALADYMENDIIDSWFYKGILVSNQLKVNEGLPEGWAGRLDAWINRWDVGFEIVEIKASHPNMFSMYPLTKPKPYNKYQCLGYIYALNNWFMKLNPLGDLKTKDFMFTRGRVIYMNRGGETEPLQFTFEFTQEDRLEIISMIKSLNNHLKNYEKSKGKDLPQVMDKEIKISKKKKKVKDKKTGKEKTVSTIEAYLDSHWLCGDFCDFCDVSCKPSLEKNKCGEFDEKGDFIVRKGYEDYKEMAAEAKIEYDSLQEAKSML